MRGFFNGNYFYYFKTGIKISVYCKEMKRFFIDRSVHTSRLYERGVTLLLAMLVASVMLSISGLVATIAYRKVTFTAAARDSSAAFFAADTALECAMYWDLTKNYFADNNNSYDIECGGRNNIEVTCVGDQSDEDDPKICSFEIQLPGRSAEADISKFENESTVDARGYSTNNPNSPRRVERAIQIQYE